MWWMALRLAHEPSSASPQSLAWWALRWTPSVALVDEAVLLEVAASERLFGGRQALGQAIVRVPPGLAPLLHGQGPTSLAALACLRERPGEGDAPLRGLPPLQGGWSLGSLSAATAHLPVLHRLGCRTWADLDALPRGGVQRRFGKGLLDALDIAMGRAPDLYPWVQCPDVFEQSLELPGLLESAAQLIEGAQRLLQSLHLWLQLRQRAVLALELRWTYDERRLEQARSETPLPTHETLEIRTSLPTRDLQHLGRLITEHLAPRTLRTPVCALAMNSLETVPAPSGSASLLQDDVQAGDSLPHLLERLSARLGTEQVQTCHTLQDHRPECMQKWHSALEGDAPLGPRLSASSPPRSRGKTSQTRESLGLRESALYPPWLLPEPLALRVQAHRPHYQGPLRLLLGPQRLEAGWWGGAETSTAPLALRDYFIASSPKAGLLWIFRERLRGADLAAQALLTAQATQAEPGARWFLHGFYG